MGKHFVNGRSLSPPWPEGLEEISFAMGCFWGAERLFWSLDGVYVTMVGYQGGNTANPDYEQVCTGDTGHAEVVRVMFDLKQITVDELLAAFWENHDPTQGNRQGNDIGSQYRSVIFAHTDKQAEQARRSLQQVQNLLLEKGLGKITTEIITGAQFWLAEDEHQQYLAKNPGGYCGLSGTGIVCGV